MYKEDNKMEKVNRRLTEQPTVCQQRADHERIKHVQEKPMPCNDKKLLTQHDDHDDFQLFYRSFCLQSYLLLVLSLSNELYRKLD